MGGLMKTHAQWVVTLALLLVADVAPRVAPGALAGAPKQRDTLAGHTEFVASVAFSPDGKTLASGSADDTIKLWDVTTGKEKATLKGGLGLGIVASVAFSPDGKTLAASVFAHVALWEVPGGKRTATL